MTPSQLAEHVAAQLAALQADASEAADAPLIVALSGGVDSLVLLHLLRFALGRPVEAAHFDHRMRAASRADAHWIAGLCNAWEVVLHSGRAAQPLRTETAARAARYAFLSDVAARRTHSDVATAHHAGDQAETILFRIVRGTGITGLAGIPPRRGRFIRPLLRAARADIERYATMQGLHPRVDPTNVELHRPRNALRHLVLPHLERSRPGAADAVLRVGEAAAGATARLQPLLAAAERSVVIERSEAAILLASAEFLAYHPEVCALILRRLLDRLGCTPGRAGTRAALQFIREGRSGGRVDLPGGIRIERSFERVVLRRVAHEPAADEVPVAIAAAERGHAHGRIGSRTVHVRWGMDGAESGPAAARFDASALRFPLLVRGWRPGDRIRLAYGTKKLKKLFGELRLDREARSRTPVLVEGRDRILWIVGHTRSVEAMPGDAPALHITVMDG